jgi:peptidoglycan hydrolase-like protein with peptidoglycan-binding domain
MNLTKEDLIRQQEILAALGFYAGQIDGIWSTQTIEAKIAFERSRTFKPAVPSNGMPFQAKERLPMGIVRTRAGLWCAQLDRPSRSSVVEKQEVKNEADQG